MTQRLSGGITPASVCDSGMRKVIGHCLNIRRMQCVLWCIAVWCVGRYSLCRCSGQTLGLGLHVLRSSITGAASLILNLCCGSPPCVKEFGYSVGKQHLSMIPSPGGMVVMSWHAHAVNDKGCCGAV